MSQSHISVVVSTPPYPKHHYKKGNMHFSTVSSLLTGKAGDNLSAALQQEIMWNNICIFRALLRSYLLNNCNYWCLCHCYLQTRTLKINMDKDDREREKKSNYLLKRHRRGSNHRRSKWEKTEREKKHRLAFLFTLKSKWHLNPKLHISISAEMHCCATERLKWHFSITNIHIMGQIYTEAYI